MSDDSADNPSQVRRIAGLGKLREKEAALRGLRSEVTDLQVRLTQLEADRAESQRLQRRVAELTDLVEEFLLSAPEGSELRRRLDQRSRDI